MAGENEDKIARDHFYLMTTAVRVELRFFESYKLSHIILHCNKNQKNVVESDNL